MLKTKKEEVCKKGINRTIIYKQSIKQLNNCIPILCEININHTMKGVLQTIHQTQ
jgi:hypothetical protein